MPIFVKITDGGLGFIMKGEGIITGQELLDAVSYRFASEERIKHYVYGISDYTEVTDSQISSAEVKIVAEKDKKVAAINPNLVIAIAAPKDVMFGLSRMFQVYAEETGWDITVYRNLEEAQSKIREKIKEKYGQDMKIEFQENE
jgi:hypothetical protein